MKTSLWHYGQSTIVIPHVSNIDAEGSNLTISLSSGKEYRLMLENKTECNQINAGLQKAIKEFWHNAGSGTYRS